MASCNRALTFVGCGTPPLSRKLDATNAKDGPNFFNSLMILVTPCHVLALKFPCNDLV
jgi:hypothetical protein